MNRRHLLKAGTLLSLGGSGCASVVTTPAAFHAASLGEFLDGLDGVRAALARADIFAAFRDPSRPDLDEVVEARTELMRKTFRSLVLAGTLAELPPEERNHPEVQRRVVDSMEEMDDAMLGMTRLLEELPGADRAQVARALREDPDLGMRLMGEVDREAGLLGVSGGARVKLRAVASHAAARLRQSPDLAIAEYTGKFRKLEVQHGARAEAERRATTALAGALLWDQHEPVDRPGAGGGTSESAPRSCRRSSDCDPTQECTEYRDLGDGNWSPGVCRPRWRIRRSPVLLGVGAAALGLGALIALPFFGAGLGVVYFVTLGAVIALSGLIVLIIGLAALARGR